MSKKRKPTRHSRPTPKHAAPPRKKPTRALSHHRPSLSKSARTPSRHPVPPVPFKRTDRILLLGEGDFSFSASLVRHHGIRHLTATGYDSEPQLVEKYPQALENVAFLRREGVLVLHGVDAGRVHRTKAIRRKRGEIVPTIPKGIREGVGGEGEGEEKEEKEEKEEEGEEEEEEEGKAVAEELGECDGGRTCGFGVIGFMFPHVGGKSTDMDRQIRSNQQLLLSFFNSSKSLLAPTGTIVTTLFEGKQYDLWDVRALAKSAGFRTQRSFRFSADMYPGYSHARTLGNIQGGGGWKGEERSARTYIFELYDDTDKVGRSKSKRKRPADCSSSSDEIDS